MESFWRLSSSWKAFLYHYIRVRWYKKCERHSISDVCTVCKNRPPSQILQRHLRKQMFVKFLVMDMKLVTSWLIINYSVVINYCVMFRTKSLSVLSMNHVRVIFTFWEWVLLVISCKLDRLKNILDKDYCENFVAHTLILW